MKLVHISVFIIVTFTLLAGCSQPEQAQQPPQAPQVDVANPISATITQWDEYSGRFEAVSEVEIRARVSGYVDSVNFRDGQQVEKGHVLFVIDQRPFKIALNSAQARYDLAKKELDRGQDLRAKNSISQEEVDRRFSEFQQANAALEAAKLDMEFTEVRSPISGLVSRDYVNVGNLISAESATLLTTVVSVDPIHFYFEAGENEFLKYSRFTQSDERKSSRNTPNPVRIKLQDETEYSHTGVMDFVDNRIDRSTGTIQGRAILDNSDGLILPGVFGRIELLARENVDVMLLPDTAIGSDQSRKFVYVVGQDNVFARKYVSIGDLHTPELRVINSGLTASDRVVVNGLMRARDGMAVEPQTVSLADQYRW
ncbi:efflux RND transporter periplasmic adaptor subunit [Alteromonas oceanisediminis]|uniref:efflux RND transporter periplasmic adaptor subunit n=1 Tax=Alteromonas oceanisediminis TaxID=2836180 RepID=UPI001BD98EDE|nr:efflux RND transporter periplasmic adaptor subunit [Alteromonas oceanisediminis]MBT0586831.1 efflux RND transporter periplasmic adaptor subunit [Alteromonas oceanisediminis]